MAEVATRAPASVRFGGRPVGAYLHAAAGMATVGSSAVVGKATVEALPVFLASALRFALAAAVLVPLLLRSANGMPQICRRAVGARSSRHSPGPSASRSSGSSGCA